MARLKAILSRLLHQEGAKSIVTSLWCALLGLMLGFLLLAIVNPSNAAYGMSSVLGNYLIFSSAEDRLNYFGQTLAKTAPLIAMSLSILVCYKVGMFNLGASGQYSFSVMVIVFFGVGLDWPWWAVMILAMLAGSLLALLTGALKTFFNVSEVISGIMLNWIALYLVNGVLTNTPSVWDAAHSESFTIAASSSAFIPQIGLDRLFAGNAIVGLGMVLVLLIAVVIFLFFKKTTLGYELRVVGKNKDAATYAGMNKARSILLASAISGALAGLAASLSLQNGFTGWKLSSTPPEIGFQGISAAFLGGLHPFGVILSSYFIVHISEGGSMITDLGYAPEIASIMTAIIIYLSGFVFFIKEVMKRSEIREEFRRLSKGKEEES